MIQLRSLAYSYAGAAALVLDAWDAAAGEHWLVMGPSGSGKTTLLHLLCGLLRAAPGQVSVDGRDLGGLAPRELDRFRGARIGFVPQRFHLVGSLSVEQNLTLARSLAGLPPSPGRVREVLAAVGMGGRLRAMPHELSQGQAQRVAVARAVVNGPALVLADEPTSSLDDASARQVLDLLGEQARSCGATLVVATHDSRCKPAFERCLVLGGTGASAKP